MGAPMQIHHSSCRRLRTIAIGLAGDNGGARHCAASTSAVDTSKFRENAHTVNGPVDQSKLVSLTPAQLETYREQGWVTPEQ